MIVGSRIIQIFGILVALAGMIGYWLTRDVEKAELTETQCEMLGIANNCETFRASFVIAGRDMFYEADKSAPVYNTRGEIVAWNYSGRRGADGTQTDTILYVNILGNDITAIALPRDIYLPELDRRINTVYAKTGGEGLKATVEGIVGLPIDYYAIINTDIFKEFVDALGGVEINIKEKMDYDDNAGNLHIHFEPGLQTLTGEDAVKFVRYRNTARGDYDRLDNVKALGYAVLYKMQALNVQAAFKLPELLEVMFANVETNATPALVRQLTMRLSALELKQTATLPTFEEGRHVSYDSQAVETFIAETFGGKSSAFQKTPEITLLITNRSGVDGLAERYKERLEHIGIPTNSILTAEDTADPTPSRLLADSEHWQDADYFVSLLQMGKQQVDHLDYFEGEKIELELVLGKDAGRSLVANQVAKQDVVVTSSR
jgi:polyisoprenyl-teichoic acid--peptidoglycan teichoic acid transferase